MSAYYENIPTTLVIHSSTGRNSSHLAFVLILLVALLA